MLLQPILGHHVCIGAGVTNQASTYNFLEDLILENDNDCSGLCIYSSVLSLLFWSILLLIKKSLL
jgi:hypothetical protein